MIDKMSEKYKSASKLIRSWRDKNFSWEKIMGCGDIGLSDDEKKDILDLNLKIIYHFVMYN